MPGCSSSGCLPLAHEVIVIITIIHSNNNDNTTKYSNIQARHIFQPVAVQSLGPVNVSGLVFLFKLGRKLADQSGDDREISFLFQQLSFVIQQYNAILLHDCFVKEE